MRDIIMTERLFDGKKYRLGSSYKEKRPANKFADNNRKGGWSARITKRQNGRYDVWLRKRV